MYTSFFGLNEKPFSITPDPRYLFMSERHGEALAHLVYGVTDSGGFMQLTGEVGTGKTTLVRTLLQNRLPDNADVAVVLNPQLSALEFLATIAEELGIGDKVDPNSTKSLTDGLNHYLLKAHAEGRRVILVVDEAQNLAPSVLEQVRLLTNLETSKQKLLQIVLIGQPELRELLARNDLRQLAQRITGRYHLEPLSRDETASYISHRLKVAGALTEVFDASAMREVFRLSQGVPRLVNVICDRALLGAYARESRRVTRGIVRRAAAEVAGEEDISWWLRWGTPALGVAGIAIVAAGVAWMISQPTVESPGPEQPVTSEIETADAPTVTDLLPAEPIVEELVAEEPALPSLDEQLQLATELTSSNKAWQELLELWRLEGDFADCTDVLATGIACLTQRGSVASLRQLDRPAVLTLVDSRGESHQVLLRSLFGDQAELSIGGVTVTHSTTQLIELWFGQFLMLWQPPNGRSIALTPGVVDDNVAWLRRSLAAIDSRYASAPAESREYNQSLEQVVRTFQRDHRLVVDGLAGRQTQIIVNSLLAPDNTPRLTRPLLAQD